ncbi:hypothetical protein V7S43_009443 [Phytophthora oleae]|uniref:Protein kinase domain-containing protein n=1 Tax=Phytophthora oleae TaxID=2107226 RepID=A0ABD3FHN0_9STRA
MADFTATPETLAGPSYESNVYAFGLLIVHIIAKGTHCGGGEYDSDDSLAAIVSGKLPCKPQDMTMTQWQLIKRMCCYNPSDRLTMADVRELEGFTNDTLTSEEFCTDCKVSDTELTVWSNLEDVRIGHITVSNLLTQVENLCKESTRGAVVVDKMKCDVYDRLLDILKQLKSQTGKPDLKTVERYGKLLRYFLMRLQTASDGDSSLAATLAASSQGADDIYSEHQDIDMFADSAGLSRSQQAYQWKDLWQLRRRELEHGTLEQLGDLPLLLEEVEDEKEREEVLTHLRFELSKHPVSYATSNNTDLQLAKAAVSRLSTSRNPNWFIPAHEVKFDKYDEFSRGSFGKVYHGSWNRSRVVVKKVELNSEADEAAFLNEVEGWHQLYHPNVVRLYGACHVQRPFFVCEFAGGGQLDHYLKEHPDELWQKLYESAQGLRYLHWKRIVHGDLKCNNILVGSDSEARLTDFGLSIVVSPDANDNNGGTELDSNEKKSFGAIRWKAPEVLQGKRSTFASGVYSFGMCVIEAVNGKFPWGSQPDIVVRHHVLEDKRIPLHPENYSQAVYTLVERMCRFDPRERIGMNAVVDELQALA